MATPIRNTTIISNYLDDTVSKCIIVANKARSKGLDPKKEIETKLVNNSRDLLEELFNIGDTKKIANEIQETGTFSAFVITRNFIKGKYGLYVQSEETINNILKLALTVLTNGCDVKITNLLSIAIKEDDKKGKYFDVIINESYKLISAYKIFIALLLTEEIRQAYNYERRPDQKATEIIDALEKNKHLSNRSSNYVKNTELIINIIEKLSFNILFRSNRLDVNTESTYSDYYLSNLVKFINKVFVNRIKENINIIDKLKLNSWVWIKDLLNYHDNPHNSRYNILVCNPSKGGFELRIGEAPNTFRNFVGVHPTVFEIFSDFMYEGCDAIITIGNRQLGICKLVSVSSLTPPLVKLTSGNTKKLNSVLLTRQVKQNIQKILSLGEILIPASIVPMYIMKNLTESYNDQLWLIKVLQEIHLNQTSENKKLISLPVKLIGKDLLFGFDIKDVVNISEQLRIPLHNSMNLDWSTISPNELNTLYEQVMSPLFKNEHIIPSDFWTILDKLGVEYDFTNKGVAISEKQAYLLSKILKKRPEMNENKSIYTLLSESSGIEIAPKIYVGLSIPLSLKNKKAENEYHGILPAIQTDVSGKNYDILSLCKFNRKINSSIYFCEACSKFVPYRVCPLCNNEAVQVFYCEQCRKVNKYERCSTCDSVTKDIGLVDYDWGELLLQATSNTHTQPYAPLIGLSSETTFTSVERLEKAILRQKHNIKVSIDGVTKFYISNLPLKFFRPNQISVDKDVLLGLGYQQDIFGNVLTSNEQILSLKQQDVIISYKLADRLRRVADFIDDMLTSLYHQEPFFQIKTIEDLVGHLIVGIPKDNECGIIGRIVGFTHADTCFSNIGWHTSSRGINRKNEYAIMLLLDVLINFSKQFINGKTPYMNPLFLQLRTNLDLTKENNSLSNLSFKDIIEVVNNSTKIEKSIDSELNILCSETYGITNLWQETPDNIQTLRSKNEKNLINLAQTQLLLINKSINLAQNTIIHTIENYLLPLLKKQIREFGTTYRCQYCNKKYRRPPIKGSCILCNKQVNSFISLETVESTYNFIIDLIESAGIDYKLDDELTVIRENISVLKYGRKQTTLLDY